MATTTATPNLTVTDLKAPATEKTTSEKIKTEMNEIKEYWKGVAAHPNTKRLTANTVKYGVVGLAVTTIDIAIKA